MANAVRLFSLILSSSLRLKGLNLMLGCALILMALPVQAQTFSVLHTFTGAQDGGNPVSGLTFDSTGLLYGTAYNWGSSACTNGCGVVFELRERNSQWSVVPLYEFNGVNGAKPWAGISEFNGIPYGTTSAGGSGGDGTAFELRPQPTPCRTSSCYWNDTLLHSFTGVPDGSNPSQGNVIFDRAGNMYGTSTNGGSFDCGTVWELSRSGDGWVESTLSNFGQTPNDGCSPESGVIFDTAGNLYGTTWSGGTGLVGTVYELTPQNGSWVKKILYNFPDGEGRPFGTPIMDSSGNLYGTIIDSVYKLSPVNGGWNYSTVYTFASCAFNAGVTLGPDGNLYGACYGGIVGYGGSVFEMPPNCNQTCIPNDLHDFSFSEGTQPMGPVVFDASGNLYGTTLYGGYTGFPCGAYGCGVVWEIAGAAEAWPR